MKPINRDIAATSIQNAYRTKVAYRTRLDRLEQARKPDALVEVHGLKTRADLNGMLGTVISGKENNRWGVSIVLDTGKTERCKIKSENIYPIGSIVSQPIIDLYFRRNEQHDNPDLLGSLMHFGEHFLVNLAYYSPREKQLIIKVLSRILNQRTKNNDVAKSKITREIASSILSILAHQDTKWLNLIKEQYTDNKEFLIPTEYHKSILMKRIKSYV